MRILVWGTGGLATRYLKFGYFVDVEIVGFVDMYKDERSFKGYTVYKPSEISMLNYDYLFVCVLRDNSTILKTCVAEKINLSNILFVSGEEKFNDVEKKHVIKLLKKEDIYNTFPAIYRDIEDRQEKKQYYNDTSILEKEIKEQALIRNLGESHVVAWIPVELLFSEKKEDTYLHKYTEEWNRQNSKWENSPIISFKPYKSLYQFFLYGTDYPREYCNWYQTLYTSRNMLSGRTDEQLIEKRFCEFKVMQKELNRGMSFFIEHPAVAKWNIKGYFNLVDGHHRTSFLYYSGLTKIPVQITRKDYELWCNSDVAESVHQLIVKQNRMDFYQPILNPYFLSINSYREDHSKSRLHHIMEYFITRKFEGKKVIDIGANLGYMGQAFYRMGAEVTLLEPDILHYELLKLINELLYANCKIVTSKFEEYDTNEKYDIAILLTVFFHYFSNEAVREKFVKQLNKMVNQMVIWESGPFPEKEKEYIIQHTKFHNYNHICYTYATNKFRELGIFTTDDSDYI